MNKERLKETKEKMKDILEDYLPKIPEGLLSDLYTLLNLEFDDLEKTIEDERKDAVQMFMIKAFDSLEREIEEEEETN